jgi:hypothetical protein
MGQGMSVKVIVILAIIGLILFYVGGMICLGAINTQKYEIEDQSDYDKYKDDTHNAMFMYKIGLIILAIGGLLALIALVGGGITNTQIDPKVRATMIGMGIALIVLIVVIVLASPGTRMAVVPSPPSYGLI